MRSTADLTQACMTLWLAERKLLDEMIYATERWQKAVDAARVAESALNARLENEE
jgi:hypothetical protein